MNHLKPNPLSLRGWHQDSAALRPTRALVSPPSDEDRATTLVDEAQVAAILTETEPAVLVWRSRRQNVVLRSLPHSPARVMGMSCSISCQTLSRRRRSRMAALSPRFLALGCTTLYAYEIVRIINRAPRDLAASSRPFRICTHTHTSHSHSSHALLCRLCWQMLDPPHSLHRLVCRLCWQIPSLRTPCITSAAPSSFPSRSLRPQAQHCEHLSAAVPRTRSAPSSGDGTTKSERSWPRSSPHTPRCFRKARRRQ